MLHRCDVQYILQNSTVFSCAEVKKQNKFSDFRFKFIFGVIVLFSCSVSLKVVLDAFFQPYNSMNMSLEMQGLHIDP